MDSAARISLLALFALSAARPPAAEAAGDTALAIKASFYDQPIAAFGGEFGARKPGACGYSAAVPGPTGRSFDVVPGMVADTLGYSREAAKLLPSRGAVDCNSQNLDKWFDARFTSASACRELGFAPVADSTGARRWRYQRDFFFPIDDLAPPGQLEGPGPSWDSIPDVTLPAGFQGPHNYNWCMEINAQFTYKGGETFRFNGDDDVWVFLDGRLVVDLGGIHGPNERKVKLDTLGFLAGRRGETFAFDMYFCERRPAGSYIDMETDLELRPVPFLDLDITLADGSFPDPKQPIIGKTRLCAKPAYGSDACRNFRPPSSDPFRRAVWSLDGTVIARDSSCIDFDPSSLPANRRILLSAKAEGKSSRLALQVLKSNRPVSAALKGDGRLESVVLRLDPRSDSLYAPLRAEFPFAGKSISLQSADAAFSVPDNTLSWKIAGDTAVTSLDSASLRAFQTILGFPLVFDAPLSDSISPAVRRASWRPDPLGGINLDVVPTEPLAAPFPPGLQGIRFKGRGGGLSTPAGPSARDGSQGNIIVTFPAGYPIDFRAFDSVSLAAPAADLSGNAARPRFVKIDPLAWEDRPAEIAAAALEKNPAEEKPFEPFAPSHSLVLLDAAGRPLNSGAEEERMARSGGPVLVIKTVEPIDRVELNVYSNLGAFVGSASRGIAAAEWDRVAAQSQGDTCTVRVLWYPVSRGAKLGTGAYVLKGSVLTRSGWRDGGNGRWLRMLPQRKLLGPIRFGFIRH